MKTDQEQKKKSNRKLIIIIAAFSVVIGLGAIAYVTYELYRVTKAIETIANVPDMAKDLEANRPDSAKGTGESSPVNWEKAVKKLEGNHFQFSRKQIDDLKITPEAVLSEGRVVPNMNGETNQLNGFKIVSVKGNGLLHLLGIKEGDILARIHGQSMDNPMAMLKAINEFKGQDEIVLTFNRENSDFDLRLTFID